ncbi:MAG: methyltransferase [Phycisphaerae bacterium]|jgi:precorrin-6B methylase 2
MPTPTRDELLQLARGFMEARILLTAAELDVFTLLAGDWLDVEQVAARCGGTRRGLTILLDALAGMGLLAKRDGRYHCESPIAQHLAADSRESVLPMVRHSASLWHRWSELTEVVRGEAESPARSRSTWDERAFIEAMAVVAGPMAASVAEVIAPASARRLLDVGTGPGSYTAALLRVAPRLHATAFDLPSVIEIARERLRAAGLEQRVTFVPGDFYADELPPGHDLALLSAIIHQNSPQQNVDLYRKVWRALEPGGRIIVRDHILQPDRAGSRPATIFAVNMLVGTEGGNCYTFAEIEANLEEAGFERVGLLQASEQMAGVVEAFKPGK